MPTFTGPVDRLPFAPPLQQWKYDRGRSVYKKGGVWVETTDPFWDTIKEADLVAKADRPGGERFTNDIDTYCFLGGRVYTVSSAVATALTAAGYGAYLT